VTNTKFKHFTFYVLFFRLTQHLMNFVTSSVYLQEPKQQYQKILYLMNPI